MRTGPMWMTFRYWTLREKTTRFFWKSTAGVFSPPFQAFHTASNTFGSAMKPVGVPLWPSVNTFTCLIGKSPCHC